MLQNDKSHNKRVLQGDNIAKIQTETELDTCFLWTWKVLDYSWEKNIHKRIYKF